MASIKTPDVHRSTVSSSEVNQRGRVLWNICFRPPIFAGRWCFTINWRYVKFCSILYMKSLEGCRKIYEKRYFKVCVFERVHYTPIKMAINVWTTRFFENFHTRFWRKTVSRYTTSTYLFWLICPRVLYRTSTECTGTAELWMYYSCSRYYPDGIIRRIF